MHLLDLSPRGAFTSAIQLVLANVCSDTTEKQSEVLFIQQPTIAGRIIISCRAVKVKRKQLTLHVSVSFVIPLYQARMRRAVAGST